MRGGRSPGKDLAMRVRQLEARLMRQQETEEELRQELRQQQAEHSEAQPEKEELKGRWTVWAECG